MSITQMVVHPEYHHKDESRGDSSMKYAETYNIGKTVIHVVAPDPMNDEEILKILKEHHMAGWAILNDLEEKKSKQES